jgi:hypothetical protein
MILFLVSLCFPQIANTPNPGDKILAEGVVHGTCLTSYHKLNNFDEDETWVTIKTKEGKQGDHLLTHCVYDYPTKKPLIDFDVLVSLLILGTFSGVIPALVLIIAISIIIGMVKSGKKATHRIVHPEEYRRMGDAEHKKAVQDALKEDHQFFS